MPIFRGFQLVRHWRKRAHFKRRNDSNNQRRFRDGWFAQENRPYRRRKSGSDVHFDGSRWKRRNLKRGVFRRRSTRQIHHRSARRNDLKLKISKLAIFAKCSILNAFFHKILKRIKLKITYWWPFVAVGFTRWWCNGQHWCLPSIRSGFDSRPSQTFFLTWLKICIPSSLKRWNFQ